MPKSFGFYNKWLPGINYARGVWHFPLISLDEEQDFPVVDRGGPENNYDEILFNESDTRILRFREVGGNPPQNQ
jgi:ureidoglycolate lyase